MKKEKRWLTRYEELKAYRFGNLETIGPVTQLVDVGFICFVEDRMPEKCKDNIRVALIAYQMGTTMAWQEKQMDRYKNAVVEKCAAKKPIAKKKGNPQNATV